MDDTTEDAKVSKVKAFAEEHINAMLDIFSYRTGKTVQGIDIYKEGGSLKVILDIKP